MQKVDEQTIVAVMERVSSQMNDAQFVTDQVNLVRDWQPQITQYVIGCRGTLSAEALVSVLFLLSVVYQAIVEADGGRKRRQVTYAELDAAANSVPNLEALAKTEPDLANYIFSNIEPDYPADLSAALAHAARALLDGAR
ncbi:MAG: hypothetical protein H6707_17355 [Deltaproteobacteria bacterium]|nr:hypothetical protein [Deltaproteobacteria bacterium]